MSIVSTQALVPFEGVIQPVLRAGYDMIDNYNSNYRPCVKSTAGFRLSRNNGNYGRLGKSLENQSALGENVDIYV